MMERGTEELLAAWRKYRFVALLLPIYASLAVAFMYTVPIFEAPDEPAHVHYIGFLAEEGRMPRYGEDPEVPGEGMQAPLYYAVALPWYLAVVGESSPLLPELYRAGLSLYRYDGRAILANRVLLPRPQRAGQQSPRRFVENPLLGFLVHLRWPSLGFGLLTVLFSFLAVLRAFEDEWLATLSSALVALNPQFIFVSAIVSNDTAASAVGACAFLMAVHALRLEVTRKIYVIAALLVVLGFVTKTSTLPVVAVACIAVFMADERARAARLRDAALAAALVAILAAPQVLWNMAHRGGPLGMGAVWQSASNLPTPDAFGGLWHYLTDIYWDWTFESYWARFGWMNVSPPKALLMAFFALGWTGALGFVLALGDGSRAGRLRWYLATTVLVAVLAHLWININVAQAQGRHLFPAIAQTSCCLAIGLARVLRGPGALPGPRIALALALLLFGAAIYSVTVVIPSAYASS